MNQCFTPRWRVGGGCSVTTGVAKLIFGFPEPMTGVSAKTFVSPLWLSIDTAEAEAAAPVAEPEPEAEPEAAEDKEQDK